MKPKLFAFILFLLFAPAGLRASMVVTPWIPIYKGVDRAVGTNFPDGTNPRLQVVNCVRVDLSDPDVQVFPTPRYTNYLADSRETMALSVSNFVKAYGVQVAINANFYWSFCCGASNPQAEGVPATAYGLLVSTGTVVSVPDGAPPGDSNPRAASILFTTNKEPILVYRNIAPGTNTTGIFSAITGYFFVLSNGVNVGDAAVTAFPDGSFHNEQPRTAIGVSADRRYLFMMTIDGRQPGYSVGAVGRETADWLMMFGASDGVTMDGGGSSSMYMADCAGNPVALNKSSYVVQSSRERIVGAHLGIYAKPLDSFVSDVAAQPASQTATVTWITASNATSQVEYGLTPSYGSLSPIDSTLTTNHSVVLNGLQPQRRYYFRVLSIAEGAQYQSTCAGSSFVTTNFAGGILMPLTQTWRYRTGSLDGVNWTMPSYEDSAWPSGPGALWADNRSLSFIPNTNSIPNFLSGTRMPVNQPTNYPYPTYYFRTAFNYSNSLEGLTLTFSNYLDDGAIFYLNGFELFRTNMPPGPVTSGTYTPAGAPCGGNATCPIVFTFTGNALSNFVVGTNVIAVEVHNFRSLSGAMLPSPDVVFESALLYSLPPPVVPPPFITNVVVLPGETTATFTWTTASNASGQILYGTNGSLGWATASETNLFSNHALVLTNLKPRQEYFFQVVSSAGTNVHRFDGSFLTIPFEMPLVTFSNVWRYTTNSLDGTNWMDIAYDDSGWLGEGPALLYLENNPDVFPRSTVLPDGAAGRAFPTYYFRTHFPFDGAGAGFALLFTNFIDDGAVFFLNGIEIQRVRMAAGVGSTYETGAAACPPNGCDATFESPDVFRVAGDWMTNLVSGDNVLSAAVHQFGLGSSDIVFGSAVSLVRARASETLLRISREGENICLSWAGEFLTLQQASGLNPTIWTDLPGPVQTSPHCLTNAAGSAFFRLRN